VGVAPKLGGFLVSAPNPSGSPPPAERPNSTPASSGNQGEDLVPRPLDRTSPQLTLRAILTGMTLGALLSACNVYTGLKIGWGLNMSITAALLSYGFWNALHGLSGGRVRRWGILENNINQTACSSGAAVSSAGLVAPIPALAMMTGESLTWHFMALWVFSVCLVGITVGIALRRQMLVRDKLRFPFGIAAAETLREMYAKGAEAVARVKILVLAGVVSMGVKLLHEAKLLAVNGLPFSVGGFSAKSLTLALDPKLLMVGVGGLIGFRACLSLLLGAGLAYAVLGPWLIGQDMVRLTVREPLHEVPAGVEFPPEPESYARFDPNKHELEWRGVMTPAHLEQLLSLSADARYQEVVRKLYVRSQRVVAEGLAQSPAGRDAVAALCAQFGYTTTRELRISEPLDELPRSFVMPLEYDDLVEYDHGRRRLVAVGSLPASGRDALLARADEWLAAHPTGAAVMATFRAAVEQLYERSHESFLPPGVVIPEELADRIAYDRQAHTLTAHGVLTDEDAAALRTLSADPDFQATVDSLIEGAAYRPAQANYNDLLQWLLWPGVTLMVVSALVSFAFSWRSMLNAIPGLRRKGANSANPPLTPEQTGEVAMKWFIVALICALILSTTLQIGLFQIFWWAAVLGILLTFVLAVVAARVSGETGITPVGAMGKVTQLLFGVMTPASPATNLMTANVTGGAASQCADLLHDLKCGYLLGAMPRYQTLAQIFGAAAGAMAGSGIYLIMIPNPGEQLLTAEWPAPAVAAWKAVAELFQVGFAALPRGAVYGMIVAGVLGVIIPVVEKVCPKRWLLAIPSPASVGLAFVIPGHNSISMFLGGLIVLLLGKLWSSWSKRFVVAIAAGLVAGEGITGAGLSIWTTVRDALAQI